MQCHGSHLSLNVHNIYWENLKTNIAVHVARECEKHQFWFFDCVASRASIALHVLHRTAWRPHVGLCDKLGWISRSEVRCNIIMSNCIMSNYVTLWRQRTVCQFTWCPQRDMSPLWPVIKLQGDSTSDRQMVTLDGGGRGPAWPVITLSLRTFVIGLDHFWNSRKTVTYPPENCGFGSTLKLAVFGFDLKTITALIVSMSTRCILIKWRVVFCRTNTAERWQHHTHPAGWWRCNWIVSRLHAASCQLLWRRILCCGPWRTVSFFIKMICNFITWCTKHDYCFYIAYVVAVLIAVRKHESSCTV